MDHFLKDELSKLLMRYPYKTIDESLRLIVNEMKSRFDNDYAVINMTGSEELNHTVIPIDEQMSLDMKLLGVADVKTMKISEPKKRIIKKPLNAKAETKTVD